MKKNLWHNAWLLFFVCTAVSGQQRTCESYRNEFSCPKNKSYKLHLTFDDGPSVIETPKVLQALKDHHIPATFFVVGERLLPPFPEENIRLVRQILSDGHSLGSHSFKHEAHTTLEESLMRDYIERARTAGADRMVDGYTLGNYLTHPPLLRLPYGDGWHPATRRAERKRGVMNAVRENGFNHVGWDLHAWDWDRARQQNPGILPILLKEICKNEGGIVLLHDIQSNTADNIGEWIRAMKCLGHSFGPMHDFMHDQAIVQSCSIIESRPDGQEINKLQNSIQNITPRVMEEAPYDHQH